MADYTLYIKTREDLKMRWITLRFMEKTLAELQDVTKSQAEKSQAYIKDLKQSIRDYNRRKENRDRRIITGDYDGYIELVNVPQNITDIDAWFDENERLICRPSQYDCTGQPFTMWYRPVKRGGRWFVYHKVGFDV